MFPEICPHSTISFVTSAAFSSERESTSIALANQHIASSALSSIESSSLHHPGSFSGDMECKIKISLVKPTLPDFIIQVLEETPTPPADSSIINSRITDSNTPIEQNEATNQRSSWFSNLLTLIKEFFLFPIQLISGEHT